MIQPKGIFLLFILSVVITPALGTDRQTCFSNALINYCGELAIESVNGTHEQMAECIDCGYQFQESWKDCMIHKNHDWLIYSDKGTRLTSYYTQCIQRFWTSEVLIIVMLVPLVVIIFVYYNRKRFLKRD